MYRCMNPGSIEISLEWEACLPLAKKYGFEGIDVNVDPAKPASYYKNALAEHGLKPGGMGLPFDFRCDEAKFKDALASLAAIAQRAAEVGVTRFPTWVLPFSDELRMKENLRFHADRFGRIAKVLNDYGCRLGLEFIGPKRVREGHKYVFVHTLEQMLDLAELSGPNVGLLLDSWHWFTSLGTVEDILALDQSQVVYVHINDAPQGIPVERQEDLVRRLPGETGVEDLAGFLHALRTIGYDGPVVPEPFDDRLSKMPPEEAARLAGDALKKVW